MRDRPLNLLSFSPKHPLSAADTGHLSDAALSPLVLYASAERAEQDPWLHVDGLSDAWKLSWIWGAELPALCPGCLSKEHEYRMFTV